MSILLSLPRGASARLLKEGRTATSVPSRSCRKARWRGAEWVKCAFYTNRRRRGASPVSGVTSQRWAAAGTNVEALQRMANEQNVQLDEMVIASVHRFESIGYAERFDTAPGGLRSEQTGRVHPADALVAEHVVALGSATNGASPMLLFALRSQVDGARGTWVVQRDAGLPRDAQRLVTRLAGRDPQHTWTRRMPLGGAGAGEFVLEGMMVGVIGASVVALFFLLVDALQGAALFTPSLLADRLFGSDPDAHALPVDLSRVAAVVTLHGALFVAFGIAAAFLVSRYVKRPFLPALCGALFLGLEGGFLLATALALPGAAAAIGHVEILAANALAAFAMALYLRRTEPHPARPDGSVVRLNRQRSR
jgi:hypothetical protein